MAITEFIPELWASTLLAQLEPTYVYSSLFNRDYEGEIKQHGDTVHITSVGDVVVKNYVEGTTVIGYDDLSDDGQTLAIDQAKYWAFKVPDIKRAQAAGDFVTPSMRSAALGLNGGVDSYVSGLIATNIDSGNILTPVAATKANAYDALVDLGTQLTLNDVPLSGRAAVVTPEFYGLLKKDDRFIAAGDQDAAAVRANGIIGAAAGMQIRVSNHAPAGSEVDSKLIIAGIDGLGGTFAEQILNTETLRLEGSFGDGVRGLHVYGAKVTRPKAFAAVPVTIA